MNNAKISKKVQRIIDDRKSKGFETEVEVLNHGNIMITTKWSILNTSIETYGPRGGLHKRTTF